MGRILLFNLLRGGAVVLGLLTLACRSEEPGLQEYARIMDPEVRESSGIVVSRQYGGLFWTHNDDGPPLLFAIGLDGRKIRSYELPVPQSDWEDIALDETGNLYLLDNTSEKEGDRCSIIRYFPEPDPYHDPTVERVETVKICYADRGYDTETLFVRDNRMYLVTKPWDGLLPRVFVADDRRDGEAHLVESLPYAAMITGGDIDARGKRIALCSYRALFIFEGEGTPVEILGGEPLVCRLNAGQIEGVSWKGDDLILTNEQGSIYWVSESDWRAQEAPYQEVAEVGVPFYAPQSLAHELPADWERGVWLTGSGDSSVRMGRMVWSDAGLHIGIEVPEGLKVPPLRREGTEDLDDWFVPGRVYVMINPEGDRKLSFGSDDRCILVGKQSEALGCDVRILRPATFIQSREISPPWIQIENRERWILLTLSAEGPGLDRMKPGSQLGFNLLVVGEQARIQSWEPLTLDFSWDAPSFWGLIELVD